MPRHKLAITCILFGLAASPTVGREIHNQEIGFSLTVPEEFSQDAVSGDKLYAFTGPEDTRGFRKSILIARMHGTIGQEKLTDSGLAKLGPGASVRQQKWQVYDLDVVRLPQHVGEADLIVLTVQIPLKREAIQVSVGGNLAIETQLWQLLDKLLDSLEGETSWLTSEDKRDQKDELAGQLIGGLLCILAVAAVVVFVVWRSRRSQLPDDASTYQNPNITN